MEEKIAKKNSLKKSIVSQIAEAQERLLLQAWTISVVWTRDDEDDFLMAVSCDQRYREAEITVNTKRCGMVNNKAIRVACYHEVAHILLWEFAALAEDRFAPPEQLINAGEQLAEIIAKIVLQ